MPGWRGVVELVLGWLSGTPAPPARPGCLDLFDTPLGSLSLFDSACAP